MTQHPVLILTKRMIVLSCLFAIALGKTLHAGPNEIQESPFRKELPFSGIEFEVYDLATQKLLLKGSESIQYNGDLLTKETHYFELNATDKKSIQTEASSVYLKDLTVEKYALTNHRTGEEISLTPDGSGSLLSSYKASKNAKETAKDTFKWKDQTIIGKTLHHFIVRNWDLILAGKSPEFALLVPMKRDSFGFRTKLKKTYKIENQEYRIISLEPSNWAIRQFVPQMDFHYTVRNQIVILEKYEGATTVPIDGDEKRLVKIEFKYLQSTAH